MTQPLTFSDIFLSGSVWNLCNNQLFSSVHAESTMRVSLRVLCLLLVPVLLLSK
jgi:hypothetical protein